jgi:hypothetical protein
MSTPGSPKPDTAGVAEPEVAFTPQMDEQILRGLVEDELALLRTMSDHGLSASAVRARAAHLGLTQQIVLRCRLAGNWPSMRRCLACEARFLSLGSHHRLCRRCQPQR